MNPRPYRDPSDLERLKSLLIAGRQANNGTYYVHIGDLQWWLFYPAAPVDFPDRIWLWERDGQLQGVCLLAPATSAYDVFVRPDFRGSAEAEAMEQWAEEQMIARGVARLEVDWIAETDSARRQSFTARGFSLSGNDLNYYTRPLQDLPSPQLPTGYAIRATLGEAELEQRALASYAAFKVKRPWDEYLGRRLSFMRSPVFVAARDRVVATPDGRIASFCIYWLDPVNKVGLFEPVGTHPDFQGQGLGKALLHDTLRRMQAEGMHTAIVCAEVKNPASNRLYESVGFTKTNKLLLFQKEI